ncbi:MAG: long-chain fatty acid--CoA ligase, partial [Acidimicrobiaceae bacterium]|nr:long-chain fatty acid--CoA ligase [Acidimicrobiaceae bacterium]
ERFGAPYSIRYSSTESGGVGLATALDAGDDEACHSVGRPRPGVQAQIRDSAGERLDPGETGELWLRSPAVMSGYWRDPESSSEALRDGWLRTGDLATVDENGLYRLAGRLSDMFIRGGYNVHPAEVEGVLSGHPGVQEVVVLPRPDPVMGEIGVAIVVPRDATKPPTLENLRTFGAGALARHKLPEDLRIVDELPRNPTGKIDRRRLG